MIGGANHKTVRRILFLHELKERIENTTHLRHVIGRSTVSADGVELVEKVDAALLGRSRRNISLSLAAVSPM